MKFLAVAFELWAVVEPESGNVLWTPGGSSTKPSLMVYDNPSSAQRALASRRIKQMLGDREVEIHRIYPAKAHTVVLRKGACQ